MAYFVDWKNFTSLDFAKIVGEKRHILILGKLECGNLLPWDRVPYWLLGWFQVNLLANNSSLGISLWVIVDFVVTLYWTICFSSFLSLTAKWSNSWLVSSSRNLHFQSPYHLIIFIYPISIVSYYFINQLEIEIIILWISFSLVQPY